MSIAYLNGRYLPLDEASLPITDRGTLFGDGVYEMIAVYDGAPRLLESHLDRLERSLSAIRITPPLARLDWQRLVRELIARNGGGHLSVYLQVTRGAAPRDHAFPDDPEPTVFAMSKPLACEETQRLRQGVAAVTTQDLRWHGCHIKSVNLLPNVLARQHAREAGAHEAVLLRDGVVNEGAASNVFVVMDGTLITPPLSAAILPGITRQLVLDLASQEGIPAREAELPESLLRSADEIWLTSTTREVLPVVRLDGDPVGTGRPGPCFGKLIAAYDRFRADLPDACVPAAGDLT